MRVPWLWVALVGGVLVDFSIWLYALSIYQLNGKPIIDIQLALTLIYVEVPLGLLAAWLAWFLFERRREEEKRLFDLAETNRKERADRIHAVVAELRIYSSEWGRIRERIRTRGFTIGTDPDIQRIGEIGTRAREAIARLRTTDLGIDEVLTVLMSAVTVIQNLGTEVSEAFRGGPIVTDGVIESLTRAGDSAKSMVDTAIPFLTSLSTKGVSPEKISGAAANASVL